MSVTVLRMSKTAHGSIYRLSSGERVTIGVASDGCGGTVMEVYLGSKCLDGDDVDPETDLRDAYSLIGVPYETVAEWKEEVFQRCVLNAPIDDRGNEP